MSYQRRSDRFSYGGAKSKNCGPFFCKKFFRKRRSTRLSIICVKGRSKWKRQYQGYIGTITLEGLEVI